MENVFETIKNSPFNISRQINEASLDRQKAIEFIEHYKDSACTDITEPGFPELSQVKPIIGDKIAMVIHLLKKKHKID